MKRLLQGVAALILASGVALAVHATKEDKKVSSDQNVCHMVYFQLKDNAADKRDKLVAACKKYLTDHEGTVYFSAGVLSDDFKRDVNVRDWDVALHVVFKNKAAHDKYQEHARHLKFIEENKDNWKSVRVFDAVTK
jgi:hypothetical protein